MNWLHLGDNNRIFLNWFWHLKSIVWTRCRTITCISITLVEIRAGLRLIHLETRAPKKTLWAFQIYYSYIFFLSICLSLKRPSLHSVPTDRLRVFLCKPTLPPRCCPGPASLIRGSSALPDPTLAVYPNCTLATQLPH